MLEKIIAPVYELETISLSDVATEKRLSENELKNLLIKKRFVLSSGKPSQKMLDEGLMMYKIITQKRRLIYDTYFTSKGYFFIQNLDNPIKRRKRIQITKILNNGHSYTDRSRF